MFAMYMSYGSKLYYTYEYFAEKTFTKVEKESFRQIIDCAIFQ